MLSVPIDPPLSSILDRPATIDLIILPGGGRGGKEGVGGRTAASDGLPPICYPGASTIATTYIRRRAVGRFGVAGIAVLLVVGAVWGGAWADGASPSAPANEFKPLPRRPVATYSIVARDSITGEMGVAVQSHWFSVGPIVPWAEAGVGAVATQSFAEPAYGPLGLELMRLGRSAAEALEALTSTDEGEAVRQVAMIDAAGSVAVHTGARCIAAAGHRTGPGYSVQANLMRNDTVWDAMADAFEGAEGDLVDRLIAALEAAEGAGGDIRGRQSAAILIVAGERGDRPWEDRLYDLRVEDHPTPVAELKRLIRLQKAYLQLNEGDVRMAEDDIEGALKAYGAATEIVPDEATNGEAAFWAGVTLVGAGREEDAGPFLARAFAQDPSWAEVLRRLPASGLLPEDPELMERLQAAMKGE